MLTFADAFRSLILFRYSALQYYLNISVIAIFRLCLAQQQCVQVTKCYSSIENNCKTRVLYRLRFHLKLR